MNAVPSSSTAPFSLSHEYKHSSSDSGSGVSSPFDSFLPSSAMVYNPWAEQSVQYDDRGRLQPFVETSEQRRARVEFMRRRDFTRRISAWLQESQISDRAPKSASLRTIDEEDEAEQEIIYSTSPSPSLPLSLRWGSGSPSPPSPSILGGTGPLQPHHTRSSSRTSSLSSISEEELTCL